MAIIIKVCFTFVLGLLAKPLANSFFMGVEFYNILLCKGNN